ncbi:MAG: GNAT family N-acetyltransferase [Geminicoccaceae bacterium]
MSIEIVVAHNTEQLLPHRKAWTDLAAESLERNAFYEPGFFLPAWTYLGAGKDWKVLLIYKGDVLIGFIPISMRGTAGGLVMEMLKHAHSYFHAPLLHRSHASKAVDAWLQWCREKSGARLVVCAGIEVGGPVATALSDRLVAVGAACLERSHHARPLLNMSDVGEGYPRSVLGKRVGRDLNRRRRRLHEMGRVVVRESQVGDDVQPTAAAFLTLESAGWKGANGSALASKTAHAQFFEAMAQALHQEGLIKFYSLLLDDRPLAIEISLLVERPTIGAFSFKTAFDESGDLRAFGPGNMLVADAVMLLRQSQPELRWIDSCARSANGFLAKLMPDSRTMATFMFGVPGLKGRVVFETARLGLEARGVWQKLAVPFGQRPNVKTGPSAKISLSAAS